MDLERESNLVREQLPPTTPSLEKKANSEELHSIGFYASRLIKTLPKEIFRPYGWRVLHAAGWLGLLITSLFLTTLPIFWGIKLGLSLLAGYAVGALGFFAHEVCHGSVVRGRRAQDVLSFIAFTPWFITPTFWRYWHNQLHHGNTQAIITDPDAFPTMKIFKHSKFMQLMYPFTPGSGYLRSYLYLFFWFSFHVLVAQTYLRFRNSVYDKLDHKRVTLEMIAQLAIWGSFLALLGTENLFWTFIIPFLTQNYFVMSYIATNHNLSPLTRINDPLVNSLTVTNWSWLESLHLNFGYHVEHHLFPGVSGVHAKVIHEALKKEFPDRFLYMPKTEAMRRLYKTPRIYKNSKTLIHPYTGEIHPTISRIDQPIL